jgi:hypothetical protein
LLYRVAAHLEGTCAGVEAVIDRFELHVEPDALEDALLDVSLERCPGCGWWMASSALVDEEGSVVGCEECRSFC